MVGGIKRKRPPRFNVGDRVRINSTMRNRIANKTAIVISVTESRYAHTLDKYIVCPVGENSEFLVWDIELTKEE